MNKNKSCFRIEKVNQRKYPSIVVYFVYSAFFIVTELFWHHPETVMVDLSPSLVCLFSVFHQSLFQCAMYVCTYIKIHDKFTYVHIFTVFLI